MLRSSSRLVGNVLRELLGSSSIAAVGQLLRIAGNRSQRGAQLQRHLGRNFALQFLLAADAFQFAEVINQAGDAEQAAINSRHRRNRDRDKRFSPAGVSNSASALPPFAILPEERLGFRPPGERLRSASSHRDNRRPRPTAEEPTTAPRKMSSALIPEGGSETQNCFRGRDWQCLTNPLIRKPALRRKDSRAPPG